MLNSKILLSSSMLAMVAACSSPAANTASSVSSASSSITGFSGADMGKFAQLASANPKPFTAAALSLTSMAPVDFYDTVTSFVEDAPFQLGNSTVTNLHATMLTNRPNFLQAASKFTTAGDMLGMNDIDFSHQPSTDDLTKSLTAVGASVPHATALALTDDGSDSNQDPDNDLEGAAPGSPTYASTTCKTGAVINAAVDSVATPSKVAVGAYCLGAFGVHAGADAISATAGNLARGALGGEAGLTESLLAEGATLVEQAGVSAWNWVRGGAHCLGGTAVAAAPAAVAEGFNQFCKPAGGK